MYWQTATLQKSPSCCFELLIHVPIQKAWLSFAPRDGTNFHSGSLNSTSFFPLLLVPKIHPMAICSKIAIFALQIIIYLNSKYIMDTPIFVMFTINVNNDNVALWQNRSIFPLIMMHISTHNELISIGHYIKLLSKFGTPIQMMVFGLLQQENLHLFAFCMCSNSIWSKEKWLPVFICDGYMNL